MKEILNESSMLKNSQNGRLSLVRVWATRRLLNHHTLETGISYTHESGLSFDYGWLRGNQATRQSGTLNRCRREKEESNQRVNCLRINRSTGLRKARPCTNVPNKPSQNSARTTEPSVSALALAHVHAIQPELET